MASVVERAKDWWEGKAPRERKLLTVLGATLVLCILAWVAMTIRGGLQAIEDKNQRTREALEAIQVKRVLDQRQASAAPVVKIPSTPVALDSYLDEIITGLGLKSPTYPTPKEVAKDGYRELSFRISLEDLEIGQLEELLEKVETKNPAVAVTELQVKRDFRDQEKLDVDMTVVTFYKKGTSEEGGGGDDDEGEEG
ncbi:MAG TPA: type II secretion system protein GspM [Kofleriaceae bacterium]|nr:type II secretion system protein GspM [Kofleriaceae bacterium]